MTSVVWFRHDLRVIDQPALQLAMEYGDQVHAIALIAPEIWSSHGWGEARVTWYRQTLGSLKPDLEQLGISLVIEHLSAEEDPALLVASYAVSIGATQVLFGLEAGLDERRRDARLSRLLEERGISAIPVVTETVIHPAELRTRVGTPFRVFTPFRKSWDSQFQSTCIGCADLSFDSNQAQDAEKRNRPIHCLDDWKPGTGPALTRLKMFLDGPVHSYHVDRDRPDLTGTSTLSPWLAVGAISPIHVFAHS
jgi:deoxyribodipyrimidine photo-lyase